MSLADSLIVRVHKLEEENERLRQQVQALNELTAPTTPPPFGLSPQERSIWAVLERRRAVPTETLIAAGGFVEKRWPNRQLHVLIKRIRTKCGPHGWVICSKYGWGYELTQKTPDGWMWGDAPRPPRGFALSEREA